MSSLREDAMTIVDESIQAVLPGGAVERALENREFKGEVYLVAIGKAAWNMARATTDVLREKVKRGIIVTKYGHSYDTIDRCEIIEAGHPIPDENSILGADRALSLVSGLETNDQLIFLISGGGSALFEKPLEGVSLEDIREITGQLLKCGADISEINTIRKRLSAVKGGRFANQCKAKILAIVLSDVIGDSLADIASGPAYPDHTTTQDAFDIVFKYGIQLNNQLKRALTKETPKEVVNCETVMTGSVLVLCEAAAKSAKKLGYAAEIISTEINSEAREFGYYLASKAKKISMGSDSEFLLKKPFALIAGGETVVHVTGNGKGGRNQEVALAAAMEIEGMRDIVVLSVGSDGTDGPTDAAGGLVDGGTVERMAINKINPADELINNNAYEALKASGDLVITGPTGTNVNDLMLVLCK